MMDGYAHNLDGSRKKCWRCGTETQLYNGAVLPCAECSGFRLWRIPAPPQLPALSSYDTNTLPDTLPRIVCLVAAVRYKHDARTPARWDFRTPEGT